MKPIPTWQSETGVDPNVVGTYGYEGAMQKEIDLLRWRNAELEAAHKCNVETIECQQDEIVALKEDIGGHPV